MDTKLARRKTFDVEYVVVTEDNIGEVSTWCGGALNNDKDSGLYIRLADKSAINQRQTKAFVGDYVLKRDASFKCYSEKAFGKSFDELVKLEGKDWAGETELDVSHEVARSAETGKFVSKKTAEENPNTTVVETFPVDLNGPDEDFGLKKFNEIPTENLRVR